MRSVLLGMILCALSVPTSSAQTATTRKAALWPFATNSPWNTPIGSGANYSQIYSGKFSYTGGAALNVTSWSLPVFMAVDGDPVRRFFDIDGNVLIGMLRCPNLARPDSQADGSLLIIDRTHAIEMWRASRNQVGDWYASACVATDLTGPGFYNGYHGIRAGGMSAVGGLIRKEELAAGNIPHVLAIAVQPTALNKNSPGPFVWPASWADGTTRPGSGYGVTGNLRMGSLLAIPPSVNITTLGLNAQGLVLARTMQDYGAYICETGGGNVIYYAEPAAASVIQSGLAGQLAKLTPHLRVVTNNGPGTVGGGGTPRRPPAPPISWK